MDTENHIVSQEISKSPCPGAEPRAKRCGRSSFQPHKRMRTYMLAAEAYIKRLKVDAYFYGDTYN